jgi:hypothetical protein
MAFASPLIVSAAAERAEKLARLVYELLDAHYDTEHLVCGNGTALDWDAHLDYLRDLQRLGREVLAEPVEQARERTPDQDSRRNSVTSETSDTNRPRS